VKLNRPHPLPLLALAAAAVLAGCGGGGSSTSTKTSGTAATAPGSTASTPAGLRQQVAECHRLVHNTKSLPASSKAKLEAACDKAAQGDTAAVKQAAREVCEEVVSRATLPGGSTARRQALAACRR
jgi:hypothetical protein